MTLPSPVSPPSRVAQTAAFAVHVLTALGGGIALLALLTAVREHWAVTFVLLGVALVIDVVDGPLARWVDAAGKLPDWSGDTLDLVVDFVTYVFVPAYVITASGFLLPLAAPLLGVAIVVSGGLYFADRRMKADDNHFRGFPALWNAVAFYLFLLKLGPAASTALVALLVVLTFVPFRVVHPVRVARLRGINMVVIAAWALLAFQTVNANFEVSFAIRAALCVIAGYILGSDLLIRALVRMAGTRAPGSGLDLP